MTPDVDPFDLQQWAALVAGIRLGVEIGEARGFDRGRAEGERDGFERGCQQRGFDLAAKDPAYWVDRDLAPLDPYSELVRRRREYLGPDREPVKAQTPEQIRARAEHSWRRVERSIAASQQERRTA